MTRPQEIRALKLRYLRLVSERKNKSASLVYARLMSLTTRELRAEMREEIRQEHHRKEIAKYRTLESQHEPAL
jgi:hypothetical protein